MNPDEIKIDTIEGQPKEEDTLTILAANVGKQASWTPPSWSKTDKIKIDVMIVGVDMSFGGTYTIKPMAGSGTVKVRVNSLTEIK